MIDALARLLGIRPDQTEDALRSERAARAALNRRGFLLAGVTASAALATGAIWSIPAVAIDEPIIKVTRHGSSLTTFDSLLKQYYSDSQRIEAMLYAPSPLLSMLQREARFT